MITTTLMLTWITTTLMLTCPCHLWPCLHSCTAQSGKWWRQMGCVHTHWWTSAVAWHWFSGQTHWIRKGYSILVDQTSFSLAPRHGRNTGRTATSPTSESGHNNYATRELFFLANLFRFPDFCKKMLRAHIHGLLKTTNPGFLKKNSQIAEIKTLGL